MNPKNLVLLGVLTTAIVSGAVVAFTNDQGGAYANTVALPGSANCAIAGAPACAEVSTAAQTHVAVDETSYATNACAFGGEGNYLMDSPTGYYSWSGIAAGAVVTDQACVDAKPTGSTPSVTVQNYDLDTHKAPVAVPADSDAGSAVAIVTPTAPRVAYEQFNEPLAVATPAETHLTGAGILMGSGSNAAWTSAQTAAATDAASTAYVQEAAGTGGFSASGSSAEVATPDPYLHSYVHVDELQSNLGTTCVHVNVQETTLFTSHLPATCA